MNYTGNILEHTVWQTEWIIFDIHNEETSLLVKYMSASRLSLIATITHILLLVFLMNYDEVLFTYDWENAVMF